MANNSVTTDIMDACDLSHTILLTMAAYHELICSHFKTQLVTGSSIDRREVLNFVTGLDGLFDSIRFKNEKLESMLKEQFAIVSRQQNG